MSKLANIYVFSDKPSRIRDLIGVATPLGDKVTAIVIGAQPEAQAAAAAGAATIIAIPSQEGVIIEDYAPSIAEAIRGAGAAGLVLLAAGKRGKCLAAKLGAALRAAVVNEASAISLDGGLAVSHMVYGGLANATETISSPLAVVTVASGALEAAPCQAVAGAEIRQGVFVPPAHPIRLVKREAKAGQAVDLAASRRVVCVGRGFAKKEDLSLAGDLASAIGGDVGCSRPIAEGEGWMEREVYVGVSGVMLNADIYIALGVSGQIQHMVGANGSKTIIAVNKDKNAPIFNFADYGIVGDLYKVVPALVAALK